MIGERLEKIAEAVHNSWWQEKIKQGATHHPDMLPYNELSEEVKEYDRVTARAVMHNLPELPIWIQVSERLPEDGTYICTLDGDLCGIEEPFTGMCGFENGKWDEEGCVIAWMPLPEPYKVEEEKWKSHIASRFEKIN